jgi:hypothetical protein
MRLLFWTCRLGPVGLLPCLNRAIACAVSIVGVIGAQRSRDVICSVVLLDE